MEISFQYQLSFCAACLDELGEYLLTDNLYWPLGARAPLGAPAYTRMTIGSILLHLENARALAVAVDQVSEVDRIESELNKLRIRWRVAWERKAHEEFQGRLRRWGQYLAELNRSDEISASSYRYEIRWRVVLDLLVSDFGTFSVANQGILSELYHVLKAKFSSGAFVWSADLSKGFPRELYWYLWGNLTT